MLNHGVLGACGAEVQLARFALLPFIPRLGGGTNAEGIDGDEHENGGVVKGVSGAPWRKNENVRRLTHAARER